MLFGREKTEEVAVDSLEGLAGRLFEKKIGNFDASAIAAVERFARARSEFISACDDLERLEAEPYVEDLYFASISTIKSQKALYAKNIRHIAETIELQGGAGKTSYEKYWSILGNINGSIEEMLRTNAGFRTVLYSYSNHLGSSKRSFSLMERSRDELKREIDAKSRDFRQYESLITEITRLKLLADELDILDGSLEVLATGKPGNAAGENNLESKLQADLGEKRREAARMSEEVSRLSSKIRLLTAPLDRAARKHDHLSLGKAKISAFVEDPVGAIRNEEDYLRFMELVKEMKGNIEKGSIETKNNEGALRAVSTLVEYNLYNEISTLRELRERERIVENEARVIEATLDEVKKAKENAARAETDIKKMHDEMESAKKSINSSEERIVSLFADYYKKKITIKK